MNTMGVADRIGLAETVSSSVEFWERGLPRSHQLTLELL